MKDLVGRWAFIIGLIIAILFGFLPMAGWVPVVLAILGLIVGFLNITEKETKGFLLAAVGLLVGGTATLGVLPGLGSILAGILKNIIFFIAAAVLVVALRSLFAMTKD